MSSFSTESKSAGRRPAFAAPDHKRYITENDGPQTVPITPSTRQKHPSNTLVLRQLTGLILDMMFPDIALWPPRVMLD